MSVVVSSRMGSGIGGRASSCARATDESERTMNKLALVAVAMVNGWAPVR
jgi:hypothetical protein